MKSIVQKANTDAPDADYPFGKIRDREGSTPGTGVNAEVYGDMHQFFDKLMDLAGIAANDLPENLTNGFQLIAALVANINANNSAGTIETESGAVLKKKVIAIGDWNMDSFGNPAVAPVHGLADTSKVRSVSVIILPDTGNQSYPINSIDSTGLCNGAVGSINTTTITLFRVTGGFFDSTTFDSTSFNRGFVTIEYEE